MNIVECITSIVKAIVNACTPDTPEIKNQKYYDKNHKKYRKQLLKTQYKELFADAPTHELQIIELLCQNNNHLMRIPRDSINLQRKMLHHGIQEDVYQVHHIIYQDENSWNGVSCIDVIRINTSIFSKLQHEFKKYGTKRIQGLPPFKHHQWYTPEEETDVQV